MLIRADARWLPIRSGIVQTVVTSPPYWGLRDYGTGKWEGGREDCDHKIHVQPRTERPHNGLNSLEYMACQEPFFKSDCGRCDARRIDSQLGLERTPEEYVANMVAVFREVWRVLRKDGTCWLVLGDSYAGSGPSGASYQSETTKRRADLAADGAFRLSKTLADRGLTYAEKKPIPPPGLKPKDLVGIPWRVAFALQADGWYLRSDIIWAKPNPMPESVTDRPTKAHEYVFLLAKSQRYYYDAEAIKETAMSEGPRGGNLLNDTAKGPNGGKERWRGNRKNDWAEFGRNRRSVWEVATMPYAGAHFATFPQKLIEPMILAGTSEKGCCPRCRAPWIRDVAKERTGGRIAELPIGHEGALRNDMEKYSGRIGETETLTLGWQPGCRCNAGPPIPCIVLDPFVGSGTVVMVARGLGRIGVGCDLKYQELSAERIYGPLFASTINA